MSNRQIRLSDSAEIKIKIPSFVNQHVSIVRNDNTVFYGLLSKVNDREVILQNMRLKDVSISLDEISELYIDTKAC